MLDVCGTKCASLLPHEKAKLPTKTIKKKGIRVLLRELSDDENESFDQHASAPADPDRPWSLAFRQYMDVVDQVPEDWSIVKWWGVSQHLIAPFSQYSRYSWQVNSSRFHPPWASLARHYLAIMSSSVSSERAFSQGGLTITKRRNRLKGILSRPCNVSSVLYDMTYYSGSHHHLPLLKLRLMMKMTGEMTRLPLRKLQKPGTKY